MATGARDPSYPDRARIDSDVRYLLRPPSTPWITFDKDQKEEILTSARKSVIDMPGLFTDAPAAMPSAPPTEPSNVVVATDIRPPVESLFDTTHDEPHAPPVAHPKQIMVAVGATLGLAAGIIVAVAVFGSRRAPAPAVAAAAPQMTAVAAPPVAVAPPTPAPPTTATEPKVKDGWAKLTIKGPAKSHRVYLDGKMLLGQGQRSFTIRCGGHSIAVGNKTDAKDVDVPCNGEYVVAK